MRERLSVEDLQKPVVFRLLKKRQKPALKGRHYPSIKRLPPEEVIFDPETKQSRTIRYAQGEPSIFKDEQPETVILTDIVFTNGTIRVTRDNPELIKFLELSNHNSGNPNRKKEKKVMFALVDDEFVAGQNLDNEVEQAEATVMVARMEYDDLIGYARVMGVDTGLSVKEIRHEMVRLAKKDPKKFIKGIDDPINKRHQVVLDAQEYGVIHIDNRSVSWKIGDEKKLIVPVPTGQKAAQWFAEWTMSDKEGDTVFKDIEKKLSKLKD